MAKTQKERPLAISFRQELCSWRFFRSEFFIYLISLALSQPFLKLDCSWRMISI